MEIKLKTGNFRKSQVTLKFPIKVLFILTLFVSEHAALFSRLTSSKSSKSQYPSLQINLNKAGSKSQGSRMSRPQAPRFVDPIFPKIAAPELPKFSRPKLPQEGIQMSDQMTIPKLNIQEFSQLMSSNLLKPVKFNSAAELAALPPLPKRRKAEPKKIFSDFNKYMPQSLSKGTSGISTGSNQLVKQVDLYSNQRKLFEEQRRLQELMRKNSRKAPKGLPMHVFSMNPNSPLAANQGVGGKIDFGDPFAPFDFAPKILRPHGIIGGALPGRKIFKLVKLPDTHGKNATFGEDTAKERRINTILFDGEGGRNVTVTAQHKNSTKFQTFESYDKPGKDRSINAFKIVSSY